MSKHWIVVCDVCKQEVRVPDDGQTVTCECPGTTWCVQPMRVERDATTKEEA